MSRARDIALPCLAAGALFVAFGLLVLLPGGDGGDFAAAAAHAGPAAAVAPLPPLSAPLRLEAGGAAVFAPAYPSRMLDRIAAAIDGVESNYGTNPGMWRADPVGPQGPMQVSAAAARDVGGGDRFDIGENLMLGRAYLARMYRRYGSWAEAVAAYNWGPARLDAWISGGRRADRLPAAVERYTGRVLLAASAPGLPLPQPELRALLFAPHPPGRVPERPATAAGRIAALRRGAAGLPRRRPVRPVDPRDPVQRLYSVVMQASPAAVHRQRRQGTDAHRR